MAYGYRYRSNRRRLGGTFGNPYAKTMGLVPVPFTRKRKYTPPGPNTNTPLRMGRRVRPKLTGKSYTSTRRQRRVKSGQVTTHGDNASISSNTIGSKYPSRFVSSMIRKIVTPQTVFTNNYTSQSSSTGKQAAYSISFIPLSQLTYMETQANGGSATSNSIRLFVKSGKFRIHFRNQSNSNARCSIYDIVCRESPPDTSLDSPIEAWQKGFTDFGVATNATIVGNTPFRSPEFRRYFRVNKVTYVNLEPGQQHEHNVYHYYNKIVDSSRFQNMVGQTVSGLTRYFMVVWHGMLGHESATPSTVSYLPVTLDIAYSTEYTFGWIEKSQPSYSLTNALPTSITDWDFMGESGDADTNNIAA